MMCEVCGKEMHGQPIKAKIDGSLMNVCKECSKFGKVIRVTPKQNKRRAATKTKANLPYSSRRYEEKTEEIIENYNMIIRTAREQNNWNREELAKKLNEKLSLVSKIENGKMEPDLKLAKKIEKLLNIKIIEIANENIGEEIKASKVRRATLGDLVKIKRK